MELQRRRVGLGGRHFVIDPDSLLMIVRLHVCTEIAPPSSEGKVVKGLPPINESIRLFVLFCSVLFCFVMYVCTSYIRVIHNVYVHTSLHSLARRLTLSCLVLSWSCLGIHQSNARSGRYYELPPPAVHFLFWGGGGGEEGFDFFVFVVFVMFGRSVRRGGGGRAVGGAAGGAAGVLRSCSRCCYHVNSYEGEWEEDRREGE